MILGISGRVGSGKTTVQEILIKEEKCWIADLDSIGHALLFKKELIEELITTFGDSILTTDGSISRTHLGKLVFNDKKKLESLNKILHPKIKQEVLEIIEKNKNKNGLVSGALIEEIDLKTCCDKILIVDANDDNIIRSIGDKFHKVSAFQRTRQEYIESGDFVVLNNFDASLKNHVYTCFDKNGFKL
ncbi:dephospho-CoA kinase [Candidatus Marinamargulisbacteria bacterium SCGC AAA071-K20]|nr:dephospho-CoA kinase [Candidatus Marinamargulisbacteria bacterium SCGC AAA071-K20]